MTDKTVDIGNVLDERHANANEAFAQRDMTTYRTIFSSDLEYTQPDGSITPTNQIFASITEQFGRLVDCCFNNRRTDLSVESSSRISETIEICAWVELRYYVFLKRRINISGSRTFTWNLGDTGWQVIRVVAHNEKIDHEGLRIAWN